MDMRQWNQKPGVFCLREQSGKPETSGFLSCRSARLSLWRKDCDEDCNTLKQGSDFLPEGSLFECFSENPGNDGQIELCERPFSARI